MKNDRGLKMLKQAGLARGSAGSPHAWPHRPIIIISLLFYMMYMYRYMYMYVDLVGRSSRSTCISTCISIDLHVESTCRSIDLHVPV